MSTSAMECPICKQKVGLAAPDHKAAADELAAHIFAEHTKKQKNGPTLLQVPASSGLLTESDRRDIEIFGHLNPSRTERRRLHKARRGNSYGRPAR